MTTLKNKNNVLSDESLKNSRSLNKKSWNNRWNGLLDIGVDYWIAGEPYGTSPYNYGTLWLAKNGGSVNCSVDGTLNVRMVISLKPGVIKKGGNGLSLSTSYKLTIIDK